MATPSTNFQKSNTNKDPNLLPILCNFLNKESVSSTMSNRSKMSEVDIRSSKRRIHSTHSLDEDSELSGMRRNITIKETSDNIFTSRKQEISFVSHGNDHSTSMRNRGMGRKQCCNIFIKKKIEIINRIEEDIMGYFTSTRVGSNGKSNSCDQHLGPEETEDGEIKKDTDDINIPKGRKTGGNGMPFKVPSKVLFSPLNFLNKGYIVHWARNKSSTNDVTDIEDRNSITRTSNVSRSDSCTCKLISDRCHNFAEIAGWWQKPSPLPMMTLPVNPPGGNKDISTGDEDRGESELWRKRILMGIRCRLPKFPGVIQYDEMGNRVAEFDPEGENVLWKKRILMGKRCRLPNFPGVIQYDDMGNRLADCESENELCKKRFLIRERALALQFSGVINYDENGNQLAESHS